MLTAGESWAVAEFIRVNVIVQGVPAAKPPDAPVNVSLPVLWFQKPAAPNLLFKEDMLKEGESDVSEPVSPCISIVDPSIRS